MARGGAVCLLVETLWSDPDFFIKRTQEDDVQNSIEEVVNDPHLHQRGMLQWVDHPELGRIVVQSSPMRYDGTPQLPHQPSRKLGEDNEGVLTGWLGLSRDDVTRLAREGVI